MLLLLTQGASWTAAGTLLPALWTPFMATEIFAKAALVPQQWMIKLVSRVTSFWTMQVRYAALATLATLATLVTQTRKPVPVAKPTAGQPLLPLRSATLQPTVAAHLTLTIG